MASGINKITLLGNLGQDPELRYMPNGNAVLNVSLFTDESYYNDQNQLVEDGEWHKLSMFGRKAEAFAKYTKKGDQVYIEGRNKTRKWEKDGVERYTTEVLVSDFRFTRGSGQQGSQPTNHSPQPAPAAQQAQVMVGHFNADGSAMEPALVQRYVNLGYTEGWQKGFIPPALPQA